MTGPDPTAAPGSLPKLLTRPLADNAELRLFVQADLEQRLASGPRLAPGDDTLEQATARLASPPATPTKSRPILAIATIALAVMWLAALVVEVPGFLMSRGSLGYRSWKFSDDRGAAHANSLIVPGSPFDFTWVPGRYWSISADRAVRQHPDDPAFYDAFCRWHMPTKISHGLPVDFDQTWRRLDPDNGAWPLLKASRAIGRSIDPKSRDSKKGLVVADPAMFTDGIAAFEEAARLPRIAFFRKTLEQRLTDSFIPPTTVSEAEAMRYAQSSFVRFRFPDPDALVLEAKRRAAAGDTASLASFLKAFRMLQLRCLDLNNDGFCGIPPLRVMQMADIAAAAGLTDEQSRLLALRDLLRLPLVRASADEIYAPAMRRAYLIVSVRFLLLATAGMLLLAGLALWFRRAPFGGAADRYSECLEPLIPFRRMLIRIALPAALPPLILFALLLPAVPADEVGKAGGISLLIALLSLVLGCHQETNRRIACLGFVSGKRALISPQVITLIALVTQGALLAGCVRFLRDSWVAPVLGMSAVPFLVFVILAMMSDLLDGFLSLAHSVRHRLLARLLQPIVLMLIVPTLLPIPFLHLAEHRQVSLSFTKETGPSFSSENPLFASRVRQLYRDWEIPESSGQINDAP